MSYFFIGSEATAHEPTGSSKSKFESAVWPSSYFVPLSLYSRDSHSDSIHSHRFFGNPKNPSTKSQPSSRSIFYFNNHIYIYIYISSSNATSKSWSVVTAFFFLLLSLREILPFSRDNHHGNPSIPKRSCSSSLSSISIHRQSSIDTGIHFLLLFPIPK